MYRSLSAGMIRKTISYTITVLFSLSLLVPPITALAKGGDKGGKSRSEFYGIVHSRPEKGFQGEWVIGGRAVTADHETEFDQSEGPLLVGGCAKVEIRNGRVHEIDSEPIQDCR